MLYESILRLCEKNGITVAQLERELKLSNATIRRWRTASPTITNVIKVADFFGITVDELVDRKENL